MMEASEPQTPPALTIDEPFPNRRRVMMEACEPQTPPASTIDEPIPSRRRVMMKASEPQTPPALTIDESFSQSPAPTPSPSREFMLTQKVKAQKRKSTTEEQANRKRPLLRLLIPDPPIYFIPTCPSAKEPRKAFPEDGGFDLFTTEPTEIDTFERAMISLGIYVMIPGGFTGTILPKSSITMETGLFVIPGTIDSGYRGILHVMVFNSNRKTKVFLPKHTNIAQMVVSKIHSSNEMLFTDRLTESKRGGHGFGRMSV